MFPLQNKWKEAIAHGLTAYLLSLGLALTLLGVTGLMAHAPLAALLLLACSGVLTLGTYNRRVALAAGCVAGFAGLLWVLMAGRTLLMEVIHALIWHFSGLTTALPLVGVPFTAVVCVLCAAAGWFVTQRNAGPYPALLLLIMAGLLVWLLDRPALLWALLPAVLSCLTLLLRAGDEDVPTARVLPLAALITVLGYCGVWAGGVTYEPLRDLAQDIRQRIYDTLFYTAPRDVFTLATEGYYPQGQGQLGGPATPRKEKVMVVNTPRKAYLRGVIKDVYTGRTWEDSVGSRRYLWSSGSYRDIRAAAFDELLPSTGKGSELLQPSRVTVRMLLDSASSMFVPQRIRTLDAEGDLIPYFNVSSEVFATRNLTLGDVWNVDAPLFTAADGALATIVPRADDPDDPNWQTVCKTYLQVPDHVDGRVYQMAAEAASGAATPYEQALAVQRYLARNFTYTLDAPQQDPTMDFVSAFLLQHKQGYCTYFASAMTVMCRTLGLPARYVEGYVANPDATGQAILTGEDGHAWTEVYFRGFGWVTFDATPTSIDYTAMPRSDDSHGGDAEEPTPTPPPEPTASPEPTAEPSPSPSPEPSSAPSDEPTAAPPPSSLPASAAPAAPEAPSAPWPWLLLLLAAAAAARVALVQPTVQAKRQRQPFGQWLAWVQASHDALRTLGFQREKQESPRAFLSRVDASGKLPVRLAPLAEMENRMFYGHAVPAAEDIANARAAYDAVRKALGPWRTARFQLERIFLPKRMRDITSA